MQFGVVNKSTILNRFVLHTLQRNIAHLDVITRKTNIKLGILKGGNWKRAAVPNNCRVDTVINKESLNVVQTFIQGNLLKFSNNKKEQSYHKKRHQIYGVISGRMKVEDVDQIILPWVYYAAC